MKHDRNAQKHGKNAQNSAEMHENSEDLAEMARRIRTKLLRRMEHIIDHAPDGLVTEVQYKADGRTYKLTDLVAAYKNVAGKPVDEGTSWRDLDNGFTIIGGDDDDQTDD